MKEPHPGMGLHWSGGQGALNGAEDSSYGNPGKKKQESHYGFLLFAGMPVAG